MPNRKTRRAANKTAPSNPRTKKATVLPDGHVAVPVKILVPIYQYLMGRPVREVEQGVVALRSVLGPQVPQEESTPDEAAAD